MTNKDKIKLVDDLIKEDHENTIADYLNLLQELEGIEASETINIKHPHNGNNKKSDCSHSHTAKKAESV